MRQIIPCIAEKCIKFPACKSKETIFCSDIYDYLYDDDSELYVWGILIEALEVYPDNEITTETRKFGAPILNVSRWRSKYGKLRKRRTRFSLPSMSEISGM